jgi:hypothetical protein
MSYVPEPVDFDMYANMDYWRFSEAVWLTVSYKLSQKVFDSKEGYSSDYDKEYSRLVEILNRSIDTSAIRDFAVAYDLINDGAPLLNMSYVTPYWFVDWIINKGYELPIELMEIELSEIGIKCILEKAEREHDEYLGMIEYEIEDGENMSYMEIQEKMKEMDIRAGRVPQDSTIKPSGAVQNEPGIREVPLSSIKGTGDYQYRFEKVGTAWNLQYGDAVLVGVKDWLGMTYLKTLLQNPGVKVSVLDLQQLAGDGDNDGRQVDEQDGYDYGDDDSGNGGGVAAWETIDSTAKGAYRNRLEVIAIEIEAARNAGDKTKVGALIKEAQIIQKALQQGSFKPKDPVIETNRKRVAKVLTDTLKNIRKLEDAYNYNDHPISGHLKRHIKKGAFCSYIVDAAKLPAWRF